MFNVPSAFSGRPSSMRRWSVSSDICGHPDLRSILKASPAGKGQGVHRRAWHILLLFPKESCGLSRVFPTADWISAKGAAYYGRVPGRMRAKAGKPA